MRRAGASPLCKPIDRDFGGWTYERSGVFDYSNLVLMALQLTRVEVSRDPELTAGGQHYRHLAIDSLLGFLLTCCVPAIEGILSRLYTVS